MPPQEWQRFVQRSDVYHSRSRSSTSASSSVPRSQDPMEQDRSHPLGQTSPVVNTTLSSSPSPRGSIPSSISHLLIDQQAGAVATTTVSRDDSPQRHRAHVRDRSASPPREHDRPYQEVQTTDTSTRPRTRPPYPPREAWNSYPPNYSRPQTPANIPTPGPAATTRRPGPTLPGLADTFASIFHGSTGQQTAPLPLDPAAMPRSGSHQQSSIPMQRSSTHPLTSATTPTFSTFSQSRPQPPQAWFTPGPLPLRDTSSWESARIQGHRQGIEDGIQAVCSGRMWVEGRQFPPPMRVPERVDLRPTPTYASHPLQTRPTPNVPPPQSGTSTGRRATRPAASVMPSISTSNSMMRTHPPPIDYDQRDLDLSSLNRRTTTRREKRQVISCFPCRGRRMKCSGGKPCESCIRRGLREECSYADSVKRRGKGRKKGSEESGASAELSGMGERRQARQEEDGGGEGADDSGTMTSPGAGTNVTYEDFSMDELEDDEGGRENEE